MSKKSVLLLLGTCFMLFSSKKLAAQFYPDSNSCFSKAFNLKIKSNNRTFACGTLKLTVSYTGNPFIMWNNGNLGSELWVSESGYYQAAAMDSNGCYDTTASVYVDIQGQKPWAYSNNYNLEFCSGNSLQLSVVSKYKGKWNSGETTSSININKGGKYFFVSTSDSGCVDSSNMLDIKEISVSKPKLIITGKTIICPQDSVILEVKSGATISWYPYGYGTRIKPASTGNYYAIASEGSLGCTANSDTVNITIYEPHLENICMITNDSNTGRNLIIWDKTPAKRTQFYEVYREAIDFGKYDLIGKVNYSAKSQFLDTAVNPKQRSFTYYIKAIDSCGNGKEESAYYTHSTLHLTANIGVSGENNLIWAPYYGLYPITSYSIFRSNNAAAFKEIDKVPITKTSYSDLTPPTGTNRYYIGINADVNCNGNSGKIQFRSNQVQVGTLAANQLKNPSVNVYPNPANQWLTIETAQIGSIIMRDRIGKEILNVPVTSKSTQLDISAIPAGLYTLTVGSFHTPICINR